MHKPQGYISNKEKQLTILPFVVFIITRKCVDNVTKL